MIRKGRKLGFIAMLVIGTIIACIVVPGMGVFKSEVRDVGGTVISPPGFSAEAGSATENSFETNYTPMVTKTASSGTIAGNSDSGAENSAASSESASSTADEYSTPSNSINSEVDSNGEVASGDVGIGKGRSDNKEVKITPIKPEQNKIITPEPTATPTSEPKAIVTLQPTATPTPEPTAIVTLQPTATPTPEPTAIPTSEPTATPTLDLKCYGAEACNPTGDPIGGGAGYSRIISETDSSVKYVVSTKAQLLSALASAKSGEVVFVRGSAVINMNGVVSVVIPTGVTLASDRGLGGSSGALIIKNQNVTNNWVESLFLAKDGARITGLQIEGEMKPKFDTSTPERNYLTGIRSINRVEVDNCEIRGWSWAGVWSGAGTSGNFAYVHHNYIHHNQAMGEGYGAEVYGGSALIEANIFDYNRHSIAASGVEGESYEARYNLDLGHDYQYEHRFDVHANPEGRTYSGYSYSIHHNTFTNETVDGYDIKYRGSEPELGVWIDHNIFTWSESWTSRPVFSYAVSLAGKGKTHVNDNLIGIPPTTLKSDGDGVIIFPAV